VQRLAALLVGAELGEDADCRRHLSPAAFEITPRHKTLGEHSQRFRFHQTTAMRSCYLERPRERVGRVSGVSTRETRGPHDAKSIRLTNWVGYSSKLIRGASRSNFGQRRIARFKRELGALEPRQSEQRTVVTL
jgi:hypothetical protein